MKKRNLFALLVAFSATLVSCETTDPVSSSSSSSNSSLVSDSSSSSSSETSSSSSSSEDSDTVDINIVVSGSGEGSVTTVNETYHAGDTVVLIIQANRGSRLGSVRFNDELIREEGGSYKFVAQEDENNVEVVFVKNVTSLSSFTFEVNERGGATLVTYSQEDRTDYIPVPVIIPNTVEIEGETYNVNSIAEGAFSTATELVSVRLNKYIDQEGLPSGCFSNCVSLEDFEVDPENSNFSVEDGVLYSPDQKTLIAFPSAHTRGEYTIKDGVEVIGHSAFKNNNSITNIKFPASVTTIGDYAFSYTRGIKELVLPENLVNLGTRAFEYCSFTSITFNSKLEKIGDYSFTYCTQFMSLNLPANIKEIGTGSFMRCGSLRWVEAPGVKTIGTLGFSECMYLYEIDIPANVKTIGRSAFEMCTNLQHITLNEGLETIGDYAFAFCTYLENFKIPASVTSIGRGFIAACGEISKIEIGEGNTKYETDSDGCLVELSGDTKILHSVPYNFYGNQEENFSYRVHDDITEIAENSFAYDAHLQTITIPATVTSIKSPFYNLTTNGIHGVFTSIVYEGSVEQWNEIDFHDMPLAPNTVIKDNAVTCLALDGGTSGSVTIQTDIE